VVASVRRPDCSSHDASTSRVWNWQRRPPRRAKRANKRVALRSGFELDDGDHPARLQGALECELYARDYYVAADAALSGGAPVFGNLARAEQNHADAVANMIRIVGGTAVMQQNVEIVVPATAADAAAECTAIELYVIEVYAGLIEDCTDDRILGALESIQASNYRHLAAVQ